jgi:hypothetical protein
MWHLVALNSCSIGTLLNPETIWEKSDSEMKQYSYLNSQHKVSAADILSNALHQASKTLHNGSS